MPTVEQLMALGVSEEDARRMLAAVEAEPAPEPEPESAPGADYAAENQRLRTALTESLVAQAALQRGVRPERMGALKKLADLTKIDPTADDAPALALEAVEHALQEVPELATGAPDIGSLGAHPRSSAAPNATTRAAFRGGMGLR